MTSRIPEIFHDGSTVTLGGLTLFPIQHYQRTTKGLVLHKSGHDRIRAHIHHAGDRGECVAALMGDLIHHHELSEEVFGCSSRPASIFRAVSKKCIKSMPAEYHQILCGHLQGDDGVVSSRAAKILVHLYDTADAYPDLDTFLHCYFRVDWLSVDKFAKFARNLLLKAIDGGNFESEFNGLSSGIEQFGEQFSRFLGNVGSSRASGTGEFCEALALLHGRLARLKKGMEIVHGLNADAV